MAKPSLEPRVLRLEKDVDGIGKKVDKHDQFINPARWVLGLILAGIISIVAIKIAGAFLK